MYGGNARDGINKKIFAQTSRLIESGVEVRLVLVGGVNQIDAIDDHIQPLLLHAWPGHEIHFFKKLYRQILARRCIRDIIEGAGSDTLLYLRYPVPIFVTPGIMAQKNIILNLASAPHSCFMAPLNSGTTLFTQSSDTDYNHGRMTRSLFAYF